MREDALGVPRFSIFYCGCKQPKSIHILFLRLQGQCKPNAEKYVLC